jgi:hypothetical protein
MIKNIILRKGIVVIILLLFIGSLVVPSSFGKIGDKRFHSDSSGIPPKKEWDLQLTFHPHVEGNWVEQTTDRGYIITGATWNDVLLIKTDNNGHEIWNKTYHGNEQSIGYAVHQTSDNGYVIIGSTVGPGGCYNNSLLIKTDSEGNEQWFKIFGGSKMDRFWSGQQTNDSGYILAGDTSSFGSGNYSSVWLMKTDDSGNEEWNKTFNDSWYGIVQQTTDGGYIIAGTKEKPQDTDICLIKTDFYGNEVWNITFNEPHDQYCRSLQQTTDCGYILTGTSYGQDHPFPGPQALILIKMDSFGHRLWNVILGIDNGTINGLCVDQTADEGYIITGCLSSPSIPGWYNILLLRTDSEGNKVWERTFGRGDLFDQGNAVQQTKDGGYIIVGNSGEEVIWLIKIASESPLKPTFIIGKISEPAVYENYTIVNTYRTFCFQLFSLKIKYFHSQEEIIIANTHIGILKNNTIFGVFKAHI